MPVIIRPATRDDAATVASLADKFRDYLMSLGDDGSHSMDAEQYLRDGFGEDPAFAGLIAELEGQAVGYLLYHHSYDIDRGGRFLYIFDLFVKEEVRLQGVGRALMEAAADVTRKAGEREMLWSVYTPNKMAKVFYEELGARYTKELEYMHWHV